MDLSCDEIGPYHFRHFLGAFPGADDELGTDDSDRLGRRDSETSNDELDALVHQLPKVILHTNLTRGR